MSSAADDRIVFYRRLFYITLFSTLVIKIILAAAVPITADEAYFIEWGQHLSYGYYDHPPMVGWILYVLLKFGNSTLLMRSPAVVMSTIIGIGIYLLLRGYDQARAYLVAVLYMISPIAVLGVLITTDGPLIIFSFLSAAFLFRALKDNSTKFYFWSGVCLGLAFLSKYFAVLLIGSYLIYYLLSDRNRDKTRGFALLFLASLPFGLINLYWNYTHCWDNILFNLLTRNHGMQLSWGKFLMWVGIVVYLVTPPLLFYLMRHRRELAERARASELKIFVYSAVIPFAFFTVLSTFKDIGLHWPLSFYGFVFLSLAIYLTNKELVTATKFMAYFTAFHLVLVTIGLVMPLKDWNFTKQYDSIVFTERNNVLWQDMMPYAGKYVFATDRYTTSAIFSYLRKQHVIVFGVNSYHGRQDDILTDFRKYAGENILIMTKSTPSVPDYAPYFKSI
ncbi:MAG: glycosyltransferase family 39 protein, partial [Acidiferrobacterales bacterium]